MVRCGLNGIVAHFHVRIDGFPTVGLKNLLRDGGEKIRHHLGQLGGREEDHFELHRKQTARHRRRNECFPRRNTLS